jgi:hypothetical protein
MRQRRKMPLLFHFGVNNENIMALLDQASTIPLAVYHTFNLLRQAS